jgi:hypothetical protein
MTTRELLTMTTVDRYPLRQQMEEATDLDGFKELALYLNVQDVSNGGSTLDVDVWHSARNRAADYFSLAKFGNVTSAYSSWAYVSANTTAFMRFLRVEAAWRTGNTTTTANAEVLVVPKS